MLSEYIIRHAKTQDLQYLPAIELAASQLFLGTPCADMAARSFRVTDETELGQGLDI